MPLDPTIPLGGVYSQGGAAAAPVNPLAALGTIAEVQNRMNQARLFGQVFQGRQIIGNAYAQSIDPTTGDLDVGKFSRLSAGAGFMAPEAQSQAMQRQLNALQVKKEQLGLASQQYGMVLKQFTPLLEKGANVTKADLWHAASELYGAVGPDGKPVINAQTILSTIGSAPESGPALQEWIQQKQLQLMDNKQQADTLWGQIHQVQLGNRQVLARVPTYPGAQATTVGNYATGLSPAEALTPVQTGVDEQGRPISTLRGNLALGGGGGGVAPPVGPGAGTAPGATGAQVAAGQGGVPLAFKAAAPGGGGGAGLAAAPNPLTGSFPTQQSTYSEKRQGDMADYEKDLDKRVNAGQDMARNVNEIVDKMREATMGGGAETYKDIGELLQAIGVHNDTVDKWANGSLAASQVIDKVSLNNSMAQLKTQLQGVGGSRMAVQEFVAYLNKNPNLVTDPRAAIQVFNLWKQFYGRDVREQGALDRFKSGLPTGDRSLDAYAAGSRDLKRWPAIWQHSDFMQNFSPTGPVNALGVRGVDKVKNWQILNGKLVEVPSTP